MSDALDPPAGRARVSLTGVLAQSVGFMGPVFSVATLLPLIVGLSAIVGSFIPLVPFFFAPIQVAIGLSIALAGATLFAFGALKARWTVGVPWKSGLELAGIGLCSALAGYGIGALFGAPS